MSHTEADLDKLINEVLDDYKNRRDLPYVCGMINGKLGRQRIFNYVKYMIFFQGMTDIEAILGQAQHARDWPPEDS
jgi:hypothetical protein